MLGAYLATHGIPGTTAHDHPRHRRAQRDGDRAYVLTVALDPDGAHRVEEGGATARPGADACARRWVGADVPIDAARRHLARDPEVGPLVARLRLPGVPGAPDPFETAATTVLGQQVRTAAARTFAARLVAAAGGSAAGGLRAFPSPAALAGLGVGRLRDAVGLTRARAETVHRLAAAAADGGLPGPGTPPADGRAWLREIPGVGPWTAEYLALRAMRDMDAFPASDLVLRRRLGGLTAAGARARAEAWRPWRGVAALHLWLAPP